jgi:hypothetical protein
LPAVYQKFHQVKLLYHPKMQQYEEPACRALDAIYDPAIDLLRQQFKLL